MSNKNIQGWLDEYAESHQNPTNKVIHWVCVPLIFLTITALLWAIPVPAAFEQVPYLNWASLASILVIAFYIRLSLTLTLGMVLFTLACLAFVAVFESNFPSLLVPSSIIAFIILWIGQFYGHKIEGKKPSFFQDLQFFMIGPAWVMAFIYRKLGFKY